MIEINDMRINNVYDSDFKIYRESWTRDYLFLYIKSPAIFVIDNIKYNVLENSVIIYHINSEQHYYANSPVYSDDFIHFNIGDDYNIMTELRLPFNTIIKLPDSTDTPDLIKYIYKEYISVNETKRMAIRLLMKLLFTKVSEFYSFPEQSKSYNSHYNKFLKLRTKIYDCPENKWNIDDMAKELNFSKSYFQSMYKKIFECSCMNDVIMSRIEHAKYLLGITSYSINEIATKCGYQNDTFFMKQFKKITGITPSAYRKKLKNKKH